MRSIRARTLLLVLGLLSLSMTLISYKSYRDAQHEIEELFDAQLAQTARMLAGMAGRDMSPRERTALQSALNQALQNRHSSDAEPLHTGHAYEGKLAFQVLDEQGKMLLQSASAPTGALAKIVADFHQQVGGLHQHHDSEPLSSLAGHLVGYHTVALEDYHWRVFMLRDRRDKHMILVAEREDVRGELATKIALLPSS